MNTKVNATRKLGPMDEQSGMHRLILGVKDGLQVDHRDGDGLNNRRDNIRVATVFQNAHNRGLSVKNTSGFKGVSFHTTDKRWQAGIYANNKQHYLGRFKEPEDATTRL